MTPSDRSQLTMTDDIMLTDGGLETVLVFHEGIDLPAFAAFPLLDQDSGRDRLRRYFAGYLMLAADTGTGFVLETPTWRANLDWGAELGYEAEDLSRINRDAVALARGLRDEWTGAGRVLISGCIGPRGDGYVPGAMMTAKQALDYHRPQVEALAGAGADLVTAFTLSYADEAIGIVTASAEVGVPSVIGFTVETDGRLPDGSLLGEAIEHVDASTGAAAAWFMINCAHPDHVLAGLPLEEEPWLSRVGAYRANASRMSHAELDEAAELDDGDPQDLAAGFVSLRDRLPALRVLGGCCGTDLRHVTAVSSAWAAKA